MSPIDIGPITGTPETEDAAEECFRAMRARGLSRHHALADAWALRAAFQAIARQFADRQPTDGSRGS